MTDNEKSLVCLQEADVAELVRRSKRSSGLWGWIGGVLSTVLAAVIAAGVVAAFSSSTIEGTEADEFQKNLTTFDNKLNGDRGALTQLGDDEDSQDSDARGIISAMLSGDAVSVKSIIQHGTDNVGYANRTNAFIRAAQNIDDAANVAARKLNYQQLAVLGDAKQILVNSAQNNFDCLSSWASPYAPPMSPMPDVRCQLKFEHHRNAYYKLGDRVLLLDECERAVNDYLGAVLPALSDEATWRSTHANPYAVSSLFAKALAFYPGQADW